MPDFIIPAERSVVPALDAAPVRYSSLIRELSSVNAIRAVKIGFRIGLGLGLRSAVDLARASDEDLLVIYDHQKAATDTPASAKDFAVTCANAGVDAAILYPRLNKPAVATAWINQLFNEDIEVILGAEMTDDQILKNNYQTDPYLPLFEQAVELGVREFAVPANKPYRLNFYRKFFDKILAGEAYSFFGIGIGRQGGNIEDFASNAPANRHAVIGKAITQADDVRLAAETFAQEILNTT